MLACHCVKDLVTDSSSCASEHAAVVSPTSFPPEFAATVSPASTKSCAISSASNASSRDSSSSSSSSRASSSSGSNSSASSSSASSFRCIASDNGYFFGPIPAVKHFFSRTVDGGSEDSDSLSIDVPLDAHLLPGNGRHKCAILPFFYLADIDNIFDLATSIACQRYVWGISQPAVGFALGKAGSVLKLVISWVDPATRIVHIASPPIDDTSRGCNTTGVWDFSNPTAALSFAQFVLNLSDDVATIFECAKAGCENNRFDWRSDNLPSQDFDSHQERVNRWVHDVDICLRNPSLPPTPPLSNPSEKSMRKEHGTLGLRPVKREGELRPKQTRPSKRDIQVGLLRKVKKLDRKESTGSQSLDATPQKKPEGSTGSQSLGATSQTFALKSALGLNDEEGDILTWTFYRNVYLCGLIKLADSAADATEINKKIDSYNSMCGFIPPTWNRNNHPNVPPYLTMFLNMLLDQAVERMNSSSSGKDGKVVTLKPEHEAVVGHRLSTLLCASVGAFTLHQRTFQPAAPNVKEAESRHEWDALFYRFYVAKDEITSPSVVLESTIHFAKNETAELVKDAEQISNVVAAQLNQARGYLDHCSAAQAHVAAHGSVVRGQALQASNHANSLLESVETHSKSERNFKAFVNNHSHREPRNGICDTMLFLAVPAAADVVAKAPFIYYPATNTNTGAKPPKTPLVDEVLLAAETKGFSPAETKELLHNPFCTRPKKLTSAETPVPNGILAFKDHLILPHSPAEYKKPSDDLGKALNQGRMYLVSVVAFYSSIGIEGHAFYTTVTSGNLGAVIMAWKSPTSKIIYLMDRNVTTFDITIPIEAYHFATFLLRLHDDRADLKRKVEEQINKKDFDVEKLVRWRKLAQSPPKKSKQGKEEGAEK
ncbi:hypothetical protein B0H12DRAFT_1326317 [Mycena haematopus]|nr:hypothetical protein B0H12DRAFT_1326317 [Mycena haematopus]